MAYDHGPIFQKSNAFAVFLVVIPLALISIRLIGNNLVVVGLVRQHPPRLIMQAGITILF